MKKIIKWVLIATAAMVVISLIYSLFQSNEDKAVFDIGNTKLEQIEKAKSLNEISAVYKQIDSLYSSNKSEEVQKAIAEVKGKRSQFEKKLKEEIEFSIKYNAYEAAKTFISERLKSPSTAKFISFSETVMMQDENMIYHIYMKVDAQNSFGAMIRTNFDVSFLPLNGKINIIEAK